MLTDLSPAERVNALRSMLKALGAHALWVPSTDEHLNEYLPTEAKRREWVSGFDGSAGDALITLDAAYVLVDGRYHEQADGQVDLSVWTVVKLGQEGALDLPGLILECRAKHLQHQGNSRPWTLATDPWALSARQYEQLHQLVSVPLGQSGVLARAKAGKLMPTAQNLIDALALPQTGTHDAGEATSNTPKEITRLPVAVAGQSSGDKLVCLRATLKEKGASLLPVAKLDQLAWLTNLRGRDVDYNPVLKGFACITPQQAHVFIEPKHHAHPAIKALKREGFTIHAYDTFRRQLARLGKGRTPLLSFGDMPAGVVLTLNPGWLTTARSSVAARVKTIAIHPIDKRKAVKNDTELHGMREANRHASVALIKAWAWLSEQPSGSVSEQAFAHQLEAFYSAHPDFQGLSFNTIAGSGAHGAIIHYGTPCAKAFLRPGELFLFDSGAHYAHLTGANAYAGTTDATRTVWIPDIQGNLRPTPEQQQWYTAVLKGHIACSQQHFPKGTTGATLDAITRSALWQCGGDYLHGTGHGVGAYLNVHEGPQNISNRSTVPLEPGMIVSVEPGFYRAGWGGIRLENLVEVVALGSTLEPSGKAVYGLKPLLYVPFDAQLIQRDSLTAAEIGWLKTYYQMIGREVRVSLSRSEQEWLDCHLAAFSS